MLERAHKFSVAACPMRVAGRPASHLRATGAGNALAGQTEMASNQLQPSSGLDRRGTGAADGSARGPSGGPAPAQVRVLHVLGSLGVGGVETWLTHLVGRLDRDRIATDFLLHSDEPGAYEGTVRAAGCRIFTCPYTREPRRYARALRHVLETAGPYHVIHSHVHHYSGYVLRVGRGAGVPVRIAHGHSDTSAADAKASLLRRAYLRLMRRELFRNMTCGLAVSREAAGALFGPAWESDPRCRILHCGIDTRSIGVADGHAARAELGIPRDAFVIGHVGRFVEAKNHRFLVEVARSVACLAPDVRFLWVGDGPLRAEVCARMSAAGLQDRLVLPGTRADVPALLAAMDAFAFPSLWEGMPLGLVEAQAAGLPCVVSDVVSPEAHVVRELITVLPLSAGARAWAMAMAATRGRPRLRREEALAVVERSTFSVPASTRALESVYGG